MHTRLFSTVLANWFFFLFFLLLVFVVSLFWFAWIIPPIPPSKIDALSYWHDKWSHSPLQQRQHPHFRRLSKLFFLITAVVNQLPSRVFLFVLIMCGTPHTAVTVMRVICAFICVWIYIYICVCVCVCTCIS
ncbi:hypothetical protein, unlikely [Trypanosoma brucei gambiense DAL972]|uniref:Uncharacterized protein n=1 Tax=Trypanosoma brucei gambiense (strain MHOM/CI/86/DAL972) TaxID=679716 RepID=C9ZN64_TRYB9|nr:hypothetical protein, unlikely [Trypanosoma brucei gambiense DAL972]CBH10718.1 hypothetical protein, unlikely [Trypanosoma brucei gambiense DAL972]|eukprot:XP_011773006.1 hypothetical protein, unlikely [Trypanosoma brucei gambiense DAL972]